MRTHVRHARPTKPPAPPPAAAPPPEPVTKEELEFQRAREQQEITDQHRGERSAMLARQAREVAELIERHEAEARVLDQRHAGQVARLWRRQGRARGPWLESVAGE